MDLYFRDYLGVSRGVNFSGFFEKKLPLFFLNLFYIDEFNAFLHTMWMMKSLIKMRLFELISEFYAFLSVISSSTLCGEKR